MPQISIIVPVYKAEQYINRCIDSILAQTFTDWELLLVDDGSPDRSGEICDEYARKDKRIRVFHKENGGVSSARNLGLDEMYGEYVTFVDADDLIAVDALNVCMNEIESNYLDILQFSFTRKEYLLGSVDGDYTGTCCLSDYLEKKKLLVSVWSSVICSSIIQKHKIKFEDQMNLAEDQLFLFECMGFAERLKRIPNRLYYYCDNPQSATNNEKIEDMVYSSKKCICFKNTHPSFAFRLDGLVLLFIEKLILRRRYSDVSTLLERLSPIYINRHPWPTKLMVKIAKYNHRLGICWGIIMYTPYVKIIEFYSKLKNKFKKQLCLK